MPSARYPRAFVPVDPSLVSTAASLLRNSLYPARGHKLSPSSGKSDGDTPIKGGHLTEARKLYRKLSRRTASHALANPILEAPTAGLSHAAPQHQQLRVTYGEHSDGRCCDALYKFCLNLLSLRVSELGNAEDGLEI